MGNTNSTPKIPTGSTHDFGSAFLCDHCPKGNDTQKCHAHCSPGTSYCTLSAAFAAHDTPRLKSMIVDTSKFSVCLGPSPSTGQNALHLAAQEDMAFIIYLLAGRGLDINARDVQGNTPLMTAVCNLSLASIKMLLRMGANANCPNINGKTPLHAAVSKSHLLRDEIIGILLQWGKKPENYLELNHFDYMSYSPLDWAIWVNQQEVALALIQHGANFCIQHRATALGARHGIRSYEHARDNSPLKHVIKNRSTDFLSKMLKARFIEPEYLDEEQRNLASIARDRFPDSNDPIHFEIEQIFSEIRQSRADFAHANSFNETTANVLV